MVDHMEVNDSAHCRTQPASAPLAPADGAAYKVNREVAVLLGWGPALLMQVAHPLVAAGVADHSGFANRPASRLGRLLGTIRAMNGIALGAPGEARAAARGVNTIHDAVHGRLREAAGVYPAGAPYSAHDSDLLLWVYATGLYAVPRAYALFVGPLTAEERDAYCRASARGAALLGVPEGALPETWDELEAHLRETVASGRIAVSSDGRALAWDVLHPYFPRALGALYWPAKLVSIGMLPPEIRRMYGYPWSPSQERALRLMAALSRMIVPRLPGVLRYWPIARRADASVPGAAAS